MMIAVDLCAFGSNAAEAMCDKLIGLTSVMARDCLVESVGSGTMPRDHEEEI